MSPFARDRVCRREWCSQPCQERLGSSGGWAAGGWGRRRGAVLALLLRPLGGALLARGLRKCDLLDATVGNVDLPRVGADCLGLRSRQRAEPTRRCPCTNCARAAACGRHEELGASFSHPSTAWSQGFGAWPKASARGSAQMAWLSSISWLHELFPNVSRLLICFFPVLVRCGLILFSAQKQRYS